MPTQPNNQPGEAELEQIYAIARQIIPDSMECESVHGVYEPMHEDQVSNLRDEIVTAISAKTEEAVRLARIEELTKVPRTTLANMNSFKADTYIDQRLAQLNQDPHQRGAR